MQPEFTYRGFQVFTNSKGQKFVQKDDFTLTVAGSINEIKKVINTITDFLAYEW